MLSKEVGMKSKTYNMVSGEEIYKLYVDAQDKEAVIAKFIEENQNKGVSERIDFFSLLLSEAIDQQDFTLVKEILEKKVDKDSYPALLTNSDMMHMGPLANVLLLDDGKEIKAYFKEALNHGHRFHKIEVDPEALKNLYECIGFQGEDCFDCLETLLKPIIVDYEVEAVGKAFDTGTLALDSIAAC